MSELTIEDFARIIDICKTTRVGEIEFKGLRVKFQDGPPGATSHSAVNVEAPRGVISDKVLREQEFLTKKRQVDELLIDDPAALEEMISNGQLEGDE